MLLLVMAFMQVETMAGTSPRRAMSTSRVARRGTAPCPLAFPTRPACKLPCKPPHCTLPDAQHPVCRPWLPALRRACSCTWGRLATVTLIRSLVAPSFPLGGRNWALFSLPTLLPPCCRSFTTSGRVARHERLLQSPSPSVGYVLLCYPCNRCQGG